MVSCWVWIGFRNGFGRSIYWSSVVIGELLGNYSGFWSGIFLFSVGSWREGVGVEWRFEVIGFFFLLCFM